MLGSSIRFVLRCDVFQYREYNIIFLWKVLNDPCIMFKKIQIEKVIRYKLSVIVCMHDKPCQFHNVSHMLYQSRGNDMVEVQAVCHWKRALFCFFFLKCYLVIVFIKISTQRRICCKMVFHNDQFNMYQFLCVSNKRHKSTIWDFIVVIQRQF